MAENKNLLIRRAEEKDIPVLEQLLEQIANVHADARPDLFVYGSQKYYKDELSRLIREAEEDDAFNGISSIEHNAEPTSKGENFKINDISKEKNSKASEAITGVKKSKTKIYVAEKDGEVLGHIFFEIQDHSGEAHRQDGKSIYIDDLCVKEEARGLSVGKQLLDFAKEYGKKAGCYHLTLTCFWGNQAAYSFYEKQGLKPLNVEMEILL